MLEKKFVPTHHQLINLKYAFVTKHPIEKQDINLIAIKSKFCQELLPVFDRLEGGEGSIVKGEILFEFAKVQLNLLEADLKRKRLNKEDYLKQVKPYLGIQMKASRMIKAFGK